MSSILSVFLCLAQAQTIQRAAAPSQIQAGIAPVGGLGRSFSFAGPALSAPSLSGALPKTALAPVVAKMHAAVAPVVIPSLAGAPSKVVSPAAEGVAVVEMMAAIQPELRTLAKPGAADAASVLGEKIMDVVLKRRSAVSLEAPKEPSSFASSRAGVLARRLLLDPRDMFAQAYEKAVKIAGSREILFFGEATASLPAVEGQTWKFSFYANGDMITVDFFLPISGGAPESREAVYRGVKAPEGKVMFNLDPYLFGRGAVASPESALALARRDRPGFGRQVSVSLRMEEEKVSGDKDLWYRFYDSLGAEVGVNARTGEVRANRMADAFFPPPGPTTVDKVKAVLAKLWVPAILATLLFLWAHSGMAAGLGFAAGLGSIAGKGLSDEQILSAAKAVAASKGGIYSFTEYNMELCLTAERLREQGATEEQMKKFYKACEDAPIKGGRFNPWSGD